MKLFITSAGLPLYDLPRYFTLTDKQAILVDGEDVQFIGPGEFKKFE